MMERRQTEIEEKQPESQRPDRPARPPAAAEPAARREPGRAIMPDVFDDMAGGVERRRRLLRLAGISIAVAGGLVILYLLLVRSDPEPQLTLPTTPANGTEGRRPERLIPSTPPVGRLLIVSEVPAEARLEVDGRTYAAGFGVDFPVRLTGDSVHRVAVTARGYRDWSSDVYIPPDSLVRIEVQLQRLSDSRGGQLASEAGGQGERSTAGEPDRVPRPRPAVPELPPVNTLPPFPTSLRDSLVVRLERGRVLWDLGRYFEAAGEYQHVIDQMEELAGSYRPTGAAQFLRARADSALRALRHECRLANVDRCP